MDVKVQAALIVGAVTALGWLITHILSLQRENVRHSQEALVRHTERQLEELYGPLAFLIIEGQQTFSDLLSVLDRKNVFPDDKALPENEMAHLDVLGRTRLFA